MPTSRRLDRLPSHELPGGVRLLVAATPRARLLGLMGLRGLDGRDALLLPRCRSVHTFGMRFLLDLVWLDGNVRVLRQDARVGPRRLRACRSARAVIEAPAGTGAEVAAALAAVSDQRGLVVGLGVGRRPAR